MLNGFEEITYNLTEEEYKLLPTFVLGFMHHIGEAKAISNKELRQGLASNNIKIGEPRVRAIINFLRRERIVKGLISSSKGYWVEKDPQKVKKYRESLIQRANEIYAVADTLSDFGEMDLPEHFAIGILEQHVKTGLEKVKDFWNKLKGKS